MDRTQRAFTLIELLVVIAIISVLLAVIMPALSDARATGISTKCMAHLKNIGLALEAYYNVSDDEFPLSQAHGGYQPGTAWLDTVEPYVDTRLQYRCPADDTPNFETEDFAVRRVTSYGINIYTGPLQRDWFPGNPLGIPPFGWRSKTRMGAKAGTVVFAAELAEFDVSGEPVYPDHFHAENWHVNPGQGDPFMDPQYDIALWRHLKRANYLYADGHVERKSFEQVFLVDDQGDKIVDHLDPGFPHPNGGWNRP